MMAEFQKVMREWKRMCKSRGNIPDDFVGAESALLFAFDRPEEVERLVMEWSAEHPEPVYPTWTEYFRMIGVFPSWSGHEILDTIHIPAETAKKLGVEPKEVT